MRLHKIIIVYIFLFELTACGTGVAKTIQSTDDTAKVLELALKTAFYHQNLPGYSPLVRPYRFKDSILFSCNILPLALLPTNLDTIKFKVLPENVIRLMIQEDSNISNPPNYLFVRSFAKSDNGYYVIIESLSCQQLGGGGSIGIDIAKVKNSFIVKGKMSSSIN